MKSALVSERGGLGEAPRGGAAHPRGHIPPVVAAHDLGYQNLVDVDTQTGRVTYRDKTAALLVSLAPGDPGHDLALHDDRAARIPIAALPVGHRVVPDHVACLSVERDDVGIVRRDVDLVAVDSERSSSATERLVWRAFERLSVFSESVAGGRIHRLDDAQRVRDIHPPVVDERCRLTEPGSERD